MYKFDGNDVLPTAKSTMADINTNANTFSGDLVVRKLQSAFCYREGCIRRALGEL
jgi:hypothetical protein